MGDTFQFRAILSSSGDEWHCLCFNCGHWSSDRDLSEATQMLRAHVADTHGVELNVSPCITSSSPYVSFVKFSVAPFDMCYANLPKMTAMSKFSVNRFPLGLPPLPS